MPARDPNQVAADWASRLGASGQKIQTGVQAVTVAPGQAAARQVNAYVANVQANAQKWQTNVAAVSLTDWQNAVISKGLQRIGAGATAAQPKFAAFMAALLPYIERGVTQLPARGTFDQNVNRMTQWATYMHGFKKPAGT